MEVIMKLANQVRLLSLLSTFLLAFCFTVPAEAQGLVTGDTIPVGSVLDQDAILIGQNVSIDGTVKGNVFVLGNQVTINGTVDGSIILIAQNARVSGTVTGGVYAAGLTFDLASPGTIQRDLYILSVSLTSGDKSSIGRDLFAIGLDSGLNGKVGRQLHTVIGPIQLYNGLMTLLGYDDLTIKLHFTSPQPSSGILPSPAGRHAHMSLIRAIPGADFDWSKWAINLLRIWAVLFIFGLLAIWRLRQPLIRSSDPLISHPWLSLGTGFLVMVGTVLLFGAGLLMAVLVFAIGLGLNSLGLWQLSLALWTSSYALLALVFVLLWFLISYGSKIVLIFTIGHWIINRIHISFDTWKMVISLLLGTLGYALLRSIPYVGWVFDIVFTAAGLGAAWLAYRHWRRNPVVTMTDVQVKSKKAISSMSIKKKISSKTG
jgi:hypothetical protein